MMVVPPRDEAELMARASALAGCELGELAQALGCRLPRDLGRHKGIVGALIEQALGAVAGSRPVPDFEHLGIELKTVPLGADQCPRESTFVCTVAVDDVHGQCWETSTVRHKLARVLWLPIESDPTLPLAARRIGQAYLWSPSREDEARLRCDWEEHMELIATGRYDELDGRLGTVLQVRPKGANRRQRITASDRDGAPAPTLPRGFYLRASFTRQVLAGAAA